MGSFRNFPDGAPAAFSEISAPYEGPILFAPGVTQDMPPGPPATDASALGTRGACDASRKRLGFSQAEFARQFMLNLRTLQDWEQGRGEPEDIARIYLRVIERNPNAVKAALEG